MQRLRLSPAGVPSPGDTDGRCSVNAVQGGFPPAGLPGAGTQGLTQAESRGCCSRQATERPGQGPWPAAPSPRPPPTGLETPEAKVRDQAPALPGPPAAPTPALGRPGWYCWGRMRTMGTAGSVALPMRTARTRPHLTLGSWGKEHSGSLFGGRGGRML